MKKRSSIPKGVRDAVLSQCRMVCPICEEPLVLDIHHLRFYSLGGDHTETNLIPLCPRCHREIHTHKVSASILRRIKNLWGRFGYRGKRLMQWVLYCQRVVTEAENSQLLSQYYVKLTPATTQGPLSGTLEDHVTTWLQEQSSRLLAVLGDYGTGKTTFLKSLQVDLAREWLSGRGAHLPILVQLRNYSRHTSIIDVLADHLHGFGLRCDDLFSFPDQQPFVFLLDGLDEMSEHSRKELRSYRFFQIAREFGSIYRLVVTSRTNFFRDLQDEQKHLALLDPGDTGLVLRPQEPDVVYVMPFTPRQVSLYLKRRFPSGHADAHSRLKKLCDFRDLSRRPILLDLLATAADDDEISTCLSDPSEVYDLIVDRWVRRDYWRGVDPNDLRTLMASMALQVFVNNRTDLKTSEIQGEVSTRLKDKILSRVDLDQFTENICISGFVVRDGGGHWQFNHRSFYEYFLACYLTDFILHSLCTRSERRSLAHQSYYNRITPECFDFLSKRLLSAKPSSYRPAPRSARGHEARILMLTDAENIAEVWEMLVQHEAQQRGRTLLLRRLDDGLAALLEAHAFQPDVLLVYGSDQRTISGKHFVMLYRLLLDGDSPIHYWAATTHLYDAAWQKRFAVQYHPSGSGGMDVFDRFLQQAFSAGSA